jgi:hypothetical protein
MYKFCIHNTKQVFTFTSSRKFVEFIHSIMDELSPISNNVYSFRGIPVSIVADDNFLIDLYL